MYNKDDKPQRILLLGDLNSRWFFRYILKSTNYNVEIVVINVTSSRLLLGSEYYEFCRKNKIKVISMYNDSGYSRCLKLVPLINQMEVFDICHVMYVTSEASLLVRMCEHKFRLIISNFWGSDFYRVTPQMEMEQKYLLDISDTIIVPAENMKRDFLIKYPQFRDIIHTVYFDSPILEQLQNENKLVKNIHEIKFPEDKIIIAVGYNGTIQQQHQLVIDALKHCGERITSKVILVFLMTYGLNEEYEKKIYKMLDGAMFQYILIKDYLSDNQIISLRKRIDVFVNANLTDAFNAAIQESMLCGSVIVSGDWLYYKEVEDKGVYINKFHDKNDLSQKISDIVKNIYTYKEKSKKNRNILMQYRNNRKHIEDWFDLYGYTYSKDMPRIKSDVWNYVLKQEEKQSKRKKLYYEVMQSWLKARINNIKPIANYIANQGYVNVVIYGAGTLGKFIYEEILCLEIEINICDQNETENEWYNRKIIKMSDLKNVNYDCIIVTPIHEYQQIQKSLNLCGAESIISLFDILSNWEVNM